MAEATDGHSKFEANVDDVKPCFKKTKQQQQKVVDDTAQWVKALATESHNLIPGAHVVEGVNQFPQVVLWPLTHR